MRETLARTETRNTVTAASPSSLCLLLRNSRKRQILGSCPLFVIVYVCSRIRRILCSVVFLLFSASKKMLITQTTKEFCKDVKSFKINECVYNLQPLHNHKCSLCCQECEKEFSTRPRQYPIFFVQEGPNPSGDIGQGHSGYYLDRPLFVIVGPIIHTTNPQT